MVSFRGPEPIKKCEILNRFPKVDQKIAILERKSRNLIKKSKILIG